MIIMIYTVNGGPNYMKNRGKTKRFFTLSYVGIEWSIIDDIPVPISLSQEGIYPFEVQCSVDEDCFCIRSFLEERDDMGIPTIEDSREEILIEGIHEDICTCGSSQ